MYVTATFAVGTVVFVVVFTSWRSPASTLLPTCWLNVKFILCGGLGSVEFGPSKRNSAALTAGAATLLLPKSALPTISPPVEAKLWLPVAGCVIRSEERR